MHGTLRSSDGGVETVTRHNALFTWELALPRPTVGCLQAIPHHPHAMLRHDTDPELSFCRGFLQVGRGVKAPF